MFQSGHRHHLSECELSEITFTWPSGVCVSLALISVQQFREGKLTWVFTSYLKKKSNGQSRSSVPGVVRSVTVLDNLW